ncbi:hypothetical protein EDC96DRAFT_541205, partial [Choanephora cucurbitarum]
MADTTISHFVVLFTAQKHKKFKTWQDGTLKYYSANKKLVLIDEKGYSIDRKFHKGGLPSIGDELEFDGHLVTVEECQSTEDSMDTTVQPVTKASPLQSTLPKKRMPNNHHDSVTVEDPMELDTATVNSFQPLKRARMGLSKRTSSVLHQHIQSIPTPNHPSVSIQRTAANNTSRSQLNTTTPTGPSIADTTSLSNLNTPTTMNEETSTSSFQPASAIPTEQQPSGPSKPFKSPMDPSQTPSSSSAQSSLQFPNSRKALSILKSKAYPKRSKVIPSHFISVADYRDRLTKTIYEHLEILLINYGMYFHSMYEKFGKTKRGQELERTMRSKGIGLYVQSELKGNRQQHSPRLRLMIRSNREHHSKYNKDDIWVVSGTSSFEASQTFLAKSTFYGPFSDGSLELDCLSARDTRVAMQVLKRDSSVYALRTISASTECMMLDALTSPQLAQLPLLPFILSNPDEPQLRSKKKGQQYQENVVVPATNSLAHIHLTNQDRVDMDQRLKDAIELYHLNSDQESVLRQVAKSVIYCPGWNETLCSPVVLVHGVYGSGKSLLAAVIIIFLQELVETVNAKREPEEAISFKILVSSMTNVAVDRILQTLLRLGYDQFIRIGSIKKIAKNLLPYTAKARATSNEELKELEAMLEDTQNSEEDQDHIATAIQHFRKADNTLQTVQAAQVVGTTFMSSSFDVFEHLQFPLCL